MIIDAPEILSEQVAVEVSLKLSQKCAEEGNTVAMIRLVDLYSLRSQKADAVGWIMLAQLGGDTNRVMQDAVRDVVCWDYGNLPAILTTNPLGAHRFTGWLNEEAKRLSLRWEDAAVNKYDMRQWLEDTQARYRQEEADKSSAAPSDDPPYSKDPPSSGDPPSSEDPPSSGDEVPSDNAPSNENLPSSEDSPPMSGNQTPSDDAPSKKDLSLNEHLPSSEDLPLNEDSSSNEDLQLQEDSNLSEDLPSKADSVVDSSVQYWQRLMEGFPEVLQRRRVHVREDLIRRHVPAVETRSAEPARVAETEPSSACEIPYCPFLGTSHAKTSRCDRVFLTRTLDSQPKSTSVKGTAPGLTFTVGEEIPRPSMRSLLWARSVMEEHEQRHAAGTEQQSSADSSNIPDEVIAGITVDSRSGKDKPQQCCHTVASSGKNGAERATSSRDTVQPESHAVVSASETSGPRDTAAELVQILDNTRSLHETLRKARAEGQAAGLAAAMRESEFE
ncbi:hypothetical protein B0A48_16750 [Cryoendolithus antarcticus]|uniref:Uncharacterized protein n=1 Tax=Cryoendolithus antarcticus TaxID=1507870 RepID=A0A1V8SDS6_9PEZI|nr:hypothetical protein B0A48_16750 [Cryoendolithus antarcticus]